MIRWNLHQIADHNGILNGVGFASRARCVRIRPDGKWMVTANKQMLTLWDAATRAQHQTFLGHSDQMNRWVISSDGTWLVTASADQTLRLCHSMTGQERDTLVGHTTVAVNDCAISPNGKWIVSASSDQTLKLWDIQTGRLQQTLQGHTDEIEQSIAHLCLQVTLSFRHLPTALEIAAAADPAAPPLTTGKSFTHSSASIQII